MARASVHIVVHGRVQGVGFRFFTRDAAHRLGLSGWVRNSSGQTVEVQAEGEEAILRSFIEHLEEGPTFGRVDALDTSWEEPTGAEDSFTLRY